MVFGTCLCALSYVEHALVSFVVLVLVNIWLKEGLQSLAGRLIQVVRTLPLVDDVIHNVLSGEVKKFTAQAEGAKSAVPVKVTLPEKGIAADQLLAEMTEIKHSDDDPEDGKMFALVYTGSSDCFDTQKKAYDMFAEKTGMTPEHEHLVRTFHHAFMHENALNPMIFPSLRRFENEIISMSAAMLRGDGNVCGSMTSGGTESILMAMKTYRDRARKLWPHITHPEMVAPITIHPAHEKAAQYFGFKILHVPVNKQFIPDIETVERKITKNTIGLLCSAPQYCHGVVDPVEDLAKLALKYGLPLHVDACFGGFMLPWVIKLGYSVPMFDFRVAGVTSISADIHKYGFGAKGASVVLYRNDEIRKHQIFAYSQWPGGLFGSPSMAGTRPGGNIAAAWAAMKSMGVDGYMDMAEKLMKTTNLLKEGINGIPGLCILGEPHMTGFAFASDDADLNILAVADVLEEDGWKSERQQYPDSLHCSIMPHHIGREQAFIEALTKAVKKLKASPSSSGGSAAMYGMVTKIPDKSIIDDFIVEFFNEVYK